jgi:D-3-phosphoglycerate dehydrogenase
VNIVDKVAVCSRSFSKNPILRTELLEKYQFVTFNDFGAQLSGDELINFLRGHDKAITALEEMNDYVLSSLPELKVIGKYGVGLDMIDLAAMARYKKRLGWKSGVNKTSAAELALSFAIIMLRNVPASYRGLLEGSWQQYTGSLLSGKVFGIIGCGNIGKELIRILQPFNCRILINDIKYDSDFNDLYSVTKTKLDELLRESDIVSIHTPLDESTRGIISAREINLMKPTSILINVARGGLVDESALKNALINNKLAAAAFDVFVNEPSVDADLIDLKNFIATPHIGGSAKEAILAMGRAAIEGLEANEIPEEGLS